MAKRQDGAMKELAYTTDTSSESEHKLKTNISR